DREVEGGNTGDDTQGLAHGPVVQPIGDLFGIVALEKLRDAAGKLDDINAAGHFTLGIAENLAMFGGKNGCQIIGVLVHEFKKLEDDARTSQWRRVSPLGSGSLGAGN